MKKKTPFLDLYYELAEIGKGNLLPRGADGLCTLTRRLAQSHQDKVDLFEPQGLEYVEYDHDWIYWGRRRYEDGCKINQFRLDVLIWCAAMNDEL